MARAFLLVMDSVGIGGANDAENFGDKGANTLGHILRACAAGQADQQGLRVGPLKCPNLAALGFFNALDLASNDPLSKDHMPGILTGFWGASDEISKGKDTPSGHWEIAGVPVTFDWGYFERTIPAIPEPILSAIYAEAKIDGSLANCHASGTEVIADFGAEHIKTGLPIFYTSSDSVLQIAAHEEAFGLDRLYDVCAAARRILDNYNIGRVIARPFIGDRPKNFVRTGNRRDYSVLPPEPTLLDRVRLAGQHVIAVGKISDIFAHQGISQSRKANGNAMIATETLRAMDDAQEGALVFSNFVDFDQLYGHRRDVAGYAAALEHFDQLLPAFIEKLKPDDLLMITADHGCDPTWPGTDHTRERVPIIGCFGKRGQNPQATSIGVRRTFADIGETIADHLGLPSGPYGTSFLNDIKTDA
ncbi:MAG: phosphopentomutase [Ahrensia sp.]|nr:phosphopentomutase [Ahrensia sp.]